MGLPLVSLCIIAYKQEGYIQEALQSAALQDYENLEIIVSDDNSPDRTFEIAKSFAKDYRGPHKIILNRNNQNLRIVGNLNKAISLAHGDYLVFLAGDDISAPNRVSSSVELIERLGVSSLCFNMRLIDSKSSFIGNYHEDDSLEVVYTLEDYLKGSFRSCGASRITKRELFDLFGMIEPTCPTEDSVLNLRAFLSTGLGYSSKIKVDYRWDGTNSSSPANILDKFDPQLIYDQYKRDLDTALEKKLINEAQYIAVYRHIGRYRLREVSARKLYARKSLIGRLAVFLPMLLSVRMDMPLKRWLYRKIKSWHAEKFY